MFMFERNKGEWRTEWGCLCQRCVRDHLFLLGQNASLGPPALEEALCAELHLEQGEESQRRGNRNSKRLRMVTNVTLGSHPMRCAVWCKYTTAACLAGVWFPLGEAELGELGTWRTTQSATKSREAISCTPALPSVMTNETQMPHLQHCWEEPPSQGSHTAQDPSAVPSTWRCTPQTALPAWGAIQGLSESDTKREPNPEVQT